MLSFCVAFGFSSVASAQNGALRKWSDASGRFSITAKLLEVSDGVAFLEDEQGKTLKIPVDRLSKADQDFINAGENPFEMVGGSPFEAATPPSNNNGSNNIGGSSAGGSTSNAANASGVNVWDSPSEVNWLSANEVPLVAVGGWNVPVPSPGDFGFDPKPTGLAKKADFHEKMHGAIINTVRGRAVIGYSTTFGVPEPVTRLALVDLRSGKAIQTEPVVAAMRPLALLDNGSTVLMVGLGDDRGKNEKHNELQLWKVNGRTVDRSASWVPFATEPGRFGRNEPVRVMKAEVLSNSQVFMLGGNGRLALFDIFERKPIWYANMNQKNLDFELSSDRSLLAMFNEKTVLAAKPETGDILGGIAYESQNPAGWNRIRWSPDGSRLLTSSQGDLRVVNIAEGTVEHDVHLADGVVAMNDLSFPNNEYALLNNSTLVHLPTRIKVCEYQGAGDVKTIGGTSFIALSTDQGGLLVGADFPHPKAAELLETAQNDPATFLVHPGVGVSIDVSKVGGQYGQKVRENLTKAISTSGYKLVPSSPIKITAEITGPKQDAVSYIGEGSHVVQKYASTVKIEWNGQTLFTQGGTNIPGFLMLSRGETIESYLAKASQSPNLSVFEGVKFPEFIQRPSGNQGNQQAARGSLMLSKFTLQGLVDSK